MKDDEHDTMDPLKEAVPVDREAVDRRVKEVGVCQAGGEFGVAAVLFTYRCTIACRHCCFGCGGKRPDVAMDAERCARYLADLHELGRVIHIAGGECMLYWEGLVEAIALAQKRSVQPHFIETNCSFATNDEIVRERLGRLRSLGVDGIYLSADPYHQAHVPAERVVRVRDVAIELFGSENVWGTRATLEEIREFEQIARDEDRLAEHVRRHPPRFVGTAYKELGRFVEHHSIDDLPPGQGWRFRHDGPDCAIEFDPAKIWELHIDPYDNIQTNCGVILGKADEIKVRRLIETGPANANVITRLLADGGPVRLAEWAAERHGFAAPQRVPDKCALCYVTRRFLRPFYPEILGPDEVYE